MGLEYVNRKRDRYFMFEGKTKTGKPKYYASRKSDGVPLDKIPEGFEFYEHPQQGIVSVRRVRTTQILPEERQQLGNWVLELAGTSYFKVEIEDDSLVVWAPGNEPAETASQFARILGPFARLHRQVHEDLFARNATYCAMFRFTLVDADKRLFTAERWCFLGSIDNWFPLDGRQPLEALARKFLPHLTRESFFNLM